MSTNEIAVIFDLDGVLIDSVGMNWQAYNQVLSDYGVMVPAVDIHRYVGRTITSQIGMLSNDFGVEIDEDRFATESARVKEGLMTELEPMSGVTSLLERLVGSEIKFGVGTSSDRTSTSQKLGAAGLSDFFEEPEVVTQDDVAVHKPNPDVFLECAKRLGVDSNKCIVVEDAPAGIEAAHNAGMKCIAIRTPYVESVQLETADLVVNSADEITNEVILELMST